MLRPAVVLSAFLFSLTITRAQDTAGPTDARARKTYQEAMNWAHRGNYSAAISSLKKAEKQDGGHCKECAYKIIDYGLKLDDFKAADAAAQDLISAAQTPKEVAEAHLERATVQLREAVEKNKMDCFAEADREFEATLAAWSNVPTACFYDGVSLAHLNRDADAKARFAQYLEIAPKDAADRERAERFIENIDLARARLAPAFAITTLDGRQVSLDRLAGKVVLIDFWATWCGPCRVSLPKIRDIAEKFSDEPLVVLSISLDSNEAKWKDFVAENHMSWPQYRDGGFDGPVSRLFSVNSIPHTFTIDADGILQEEHVGSHADFQGRLKKLLARAHQRQEALQVAPKPRS